jgi:hypothetical protein
MVAVLPDDLPGLRDKALLLLGFAGAFRRSEVDGLQVRDGQLGDAGLIATLRRTKTDREGASLTKGIPVGTSDATCPKRGLEAWLQLAGITTGPIFRPIDRWGHVGDRALSSLGVARAVKRALTAIGRETTDYSGHSLRAGLVMQQRWQRSASASLCSRLGTRTPPCCAATSAKAHCSARTLRRLSSYSSPIYIQ